MRLIERPANPANLTQLHRWMRTVLRNRAVDAVRRRPDVESDVSFEVLVETGWV